MGNVGTLKVIVWPTYMGVAQGHPGELEGMAPAHEPFDDINYDRGQIFWTQNPDGVTGVATVYIPKGIYTHLVFCSGPHQPALMASKQLEQPIVFDRPGSVEINPIKNTDYLPR